MSNHKGPRDPRSIIQQPQVKINPKDLQNITCETCGNATFVTVFILKKVSALIAPSGKDEMIGLQVYACNACGHVNKEFLQAFVGDSEGKEDKQPEPPKSSLTLLP